MNALVLALLLLAPATPAERIQSDVTRLAGDAWQGRRAGTRGADQAAEWLGKQLQRIGLSPGERGSWFQPFSFIDGVTLGAKNQLAVGERTFKAGVDFRPLAFSSPGSVAGAAVFAGYGIVAKELTWDDYEGLDAKGKIVVVLRFSPAGDDTQSKWGAFMALRQKASLARDHGARALLLVTGPGTPKVADELVPLRADASLSDAGLPVLSIRRAVADALFAGSGTTLADAQIRIDHGKPEPLRLASRAELVADVAPKRSATRNVVGVLPGSDPAAGTIVAGAHYDHLGLGMVGSLDPAPDGKIHHGADDNASGVAALLELARRLKTGTPRARSVTFVAFGAEEEGALGSSYFVKNPPVPLERIAAMVNMDMVGRMRDDGLDVHGVGTSSAWKPLVEEADKSAGLKLRLHEGGFGPSDHNPFYVAGRPVLFVFTGVHADYHRPSDTADKINAAGIAKVVELMGAIVSGMAGNSEPVAFTRVAADKEEQTASRGFRVWVGGIPDYSAEAPGVTLAGITPGSPAEQAGLQAGDVIVRFGGKEIRNIYDYTYALGEHQPGDTVEAVLKRAGQDVRLDITLGTRPSAAR
jgi:hypothetical protein